MKAYPITAIRLAVLGIAISTGPLCHAASDTPPPAAQIPKLQISGSTLGGLVEVLRRETGANIVISPATVDLPVPDLMLQNVTPYGVLLACSLSGIPISVQSNDGNGPNDRGIIVVTSTYQPALSSETKVFNIRRLISGDAAPPKLEALAALVGDIRETTRAAIHSAAEISGSKPGKLAIEVNDATQLMIVTGTPQDVDTVRQVIEALAQNTPAASATNQGFEEATKRLNDAMKRLEEAAKH